jgi:hypothetical protein
MVSDPEMKPWHWDRGLKDLAFMQHLNPIERIERLPPVSCFPVIWLEKESKLYLSRAKPPSKEMQYTFRDMTKEFLNKYFVQKLVVPHEQLALSLGEKTYANENVISKDYIEPTKWRNPFLYRKMMTNNLSLREVFIPSKGYKMCSTFWHMIGDQILQKCEHVYTHQTFDEVEEIIKQRFTSTCQSLDLKGEALMMPREFFMIIMQEICKLYPHADLLDQKRVANELFLDFSIKFESGEVEYLPRGVGLGYFASLKTMMSAIIVDSCNPIFMFSDDMLIPTIHYRKAVELMDSLSMVIHETKSGKRFMNALIFLRMVFLKRSGKFSWGVKNFSLLSAVFSQAHHWERKEVSYYLTPGQKIVLLLNYYQIWGTEFFFGDLLKHRFNFGIFGNGIPEEWGTVRSKQLYKLKKPLSTVATVGPSPIPWLSTLDIRVSNRYQKDRYKCWKFGTSGNLQQMMVEEEIPYRVYPRKLDRLYKTPRPTAPEWYEKELNLVHSIRTELFTKGLTLKEYLYAFRSNLHSTDPVESYLSGGYDSPFPIRTKELGDDVLQTIYEKYEANITEDRSVTCILFDKEKEKYGLFDLDPTLFVNPEDYIDCMAYIPYALQELSTREIEHNIGYSLYGGYLVHGYDSVSF